MLHSQSRGPLKRAALSAFIFTLLFFNLHGQAQPLPKDALAQLPGQKLSMELVLIRAMDKTDSFQQVKSERVLAPASKLAAEAIYDPKLTLSASRSVSEYEPAIEETSPDETEADNYSAKLEKYFSSGTSLGLEVEHQKINMTYPSGSFISVDPYHESTWKVSASQNLWKDAFGSASRRKLKSAKLASKAQEEKALNALESWTLGMADLYYSAWLAKQAVLIADGNFTRRSKLLSTTRLKRSRGTAETPDVLQVESVHLAAKARKELAEQNLNDLWRDLVISLKLPAEWIQIDPRQIPIALDDPMGPAKLACTKFRKTGLPDAGSSEMRLNQYLSESSELMADALKSEIRPTVSLFGEYGSNGVNAEGSDAFDEAQNLDHPAWTVGVSFSMPFSFDGEKSQYLKAYADSIRFTAAYNQSKSRLQVAWINSCANLDRLIQNTQTTRDAYEKQQRREVLEEKRFRVGRVTTFNYIQAGDDAADAEYQLAQSEVDMRKQAWMVLQIADQIPSHLKTLAQELRKQEKTP